MVTMGILERVSFHVKAGEGLNFLWVIDFEHEKRLHHGAFIRYFNFAPELIAQGHSVTFAVNFLDEDRGPGLKYFQELKTRGVFTDFVEANLGAPAWGLRAAARLIYPGLANLAMWPVQRKYAALIDGIARERGVDVILISGTRLLFLPLQSRSGCAFLYDLGDCQTLYARRQIAVQWRARDFASLGSGLKTTMFAYAREHYYSRMPVMKIMVSPVDKKAIDEISGYSETSEVILNGVRDGEPRGKYPKIAGRIIFTGNMDFSPNYEAALWFLDQVWPLVIRQRPDACFVIAGANPIAALRERASVNVIITGYVDDLNREIACSEVFVAPMISGGGFKNKVLEAIANRTSVVASSIAAESFSDEFRGLLTIADSPAQMAEAIFAVWNDPGKAEAQADALHELVMAQFGWGTWAAKIAELAQQVKTQAAEP